MESMIANVQAIANKNNSATLDEKTISNLASSTKDLFKDVTASNSSSSLADAKKQFSEQSESLFVTFTDIATSMVEQTNSSSEISYTREEVEKIRKEYEEKGISLTDEQIIEILNSTTNSNAYLRAEEINNSVLVDSTTKKPISDTKKAEIVNAIKEYAHGSQNTLTNPELSSPSVGFNSVINLHSGIIANQFKSGPFEYKSTEPDNFVIPSDQEVDAYIAKLLNSNNVEIDRIQTLLNKKNASQNIGSSNVGTMSTSNIDYLTFTTNTIGKIIGNEVKGSTTTAIGYKGYNYSIQIGNVGQDTSTIALLANNDDTIWYYFPISSYPSEENIVAYGSKNNITANDEFIELLIKGDLWPNQYSRITKEGYNELITVFNGPNMAEIDWYAGK